MHCTPGSGTWRRRHRSNQLVAKALEPLDGDRKCFRLIGGVLVERNVAEVLPSREAQP